VCNIARAVKSKQKRKIKTTKMKVLVVGSGGREHALAWALSKSESNPQIFCAPGNAGIAQIAKCVSIQATDICSLVQFAEDNKIDLTVVGPESSLAVGVVDEFERRGLSIMGASLAAAQLEASKAFAKDFMARHSIPTARYKVASSADEAIQILKSGEFGNENSAVVVKADGLAAGKGVVVATNHREAIAAIEEMMIRGSVGKEAAERVVLEEALIGREASQILFADGKDYVLMPAARDHKRVGEGDTGPNTGGMGVVTDSNVLNEALREKIEREIVEPSLEGTIKDGFPFRGVLFIGLMLTSDGPKVLEYNVRFGDPEAQAILVRLQSDMVEACASIARGALAQTKVQFSNDASACVVLAARGYPAKPESGHVISGIEKAARHESVQIFHAGTKRGEQGEWLTTGGRVLGVTATGEDLEEALSRSYAAVNEISWEGMHYRKDIGKIADFQLPSSD
jgi:phosphoribosylamine--glycine ligase